MSRLMLYRANVVSFKNRRYIKLFFLSLLKLLPAAEGGYVISKSTIYPSPACDIVRFVKLNHPPIELIVVKPLRTASG